MAKEKLAILSSYNELCGNASYTKALADGLSLHYDVTVVSLNVDLLRRGDSKVARMHIKEICEELSKFDCVNIQFEAGLFGADLKSMKKRFFTIIKSCKRVMLTMHRYQAHDKYPLFSTWLKDLSERKIGRLVHAIRVVYGNNRYVPLYDSVINYCKKRNIPILVHTKRDRELINIKFSYFNVFDHPICYYDQAYIESLKRDDPRKKLISRLSLDESKTYIGIFGFIGGYKGYEAIIQAMQYLPHNYELLIMGAQHPHTIQHSLPIDGYILSLLKLIEKLGLTKRIKFHRLMNDEDFLLSMLGCDFNVLPYLEVKQGGSAVAALSLEAGAKSIFSQNNAFFELEKYAVNAFKMFSIGNYLELANAILSYHQADFSENLKAYHNKYNIRTSVELYKKLISLTAEVPIKTSVHVPDGAAGLKGAV